MLLLLDLVAVFIAVSLIGVRATEGKLALVNVLFRHGDRTPDSPGKESYPMDPYENSEFNPYGPGALTNIGKKRSYDFGVLLRDRYKEFLGEEYLPKEIFARSTDVPRTKMSMMLVLAGLYPPPPSQRWHETLLWQPIPFDTFHIFQDHTLLPFSCPSFRVLQRQVFESQEFREQFSQYDQLRRELSSVTGENITTPTDLFHLYGTLYAESQMGLDLPEWTRPYFPDQLRNAANFYLKSLHRTDVMKRWTGKLLRHMINNMNRTQAGTFPDRKIYLYSGHDKNVFGLYSGLGFQDFFVPEFGSALILELHKVQNNYYVKVLRYLGIPSTLETLTIPGCQTLCPYEQFIILTREALPRDDEMFCTSDRTLFQ